MIFADRADAGIGLAGALSQYAGQDVVIVGLPRGGVVPAAEVASRLNAPLDLIVSKKITHPWAAEYAIGAVSETCEPIWSLDGLRSTTSIWRKQHAKRIQQQAREAHLKYLSLPKPSHYKNKTVILVDDGAATGLTMASAVNEAKSLSPTKVVVALPVAPAGMHVGAADDLVVLHVPRSDFESVGRYYFDFSQVADNDVVRLLQRSTVYSPTDSFDLESINEVVSRITSFPTTSETLARTARSFPTTQSVVDFFESLPEEESFNSRQDVVERALLIHQILDAELSEPKDNSIPGD